MIPFKRCTQQSYLKETYSIKYKVYWTRAITTTTTTTTTFIVAIYLNTIKLRRSRCCQNSGLILQENQGSETTRHLQHCET